jgi:peptide/nickel transport system substrate-binding protein
MIDSYWTRLTTQRMSRRVALATTGVTATAAALLAACGSGGGKSGGSTSDKSSLVAQPADTTKTAKRAGTLKSRNFADPATLDVTTPNNPITPFYDCVYNCLVVFQPGFLKPTENVVAPDLAESWETSPDGLQITLKLRQGVKWHNKAPVNGRALDMDDVLFSWNRYITKFSGRVGVYNGANPDAPVLSLTATDPKTLVMKLKEPLVYVLNLFVMSGASGPITMPKETDSTFDPRADMIGTGPWMLTSYQPSVGLTLKRNPDYYDKDWALAEQIDMPIISEYATAFSQLKAGNLHIFGPNTNTLVKAEDIVPLKQEEPRISVYQSDLALTPSGATQNFGWLPAGKSPFLDERVRQAVSMSIDRDLFLESVFNVSKFQSQGLPVSTSWSTALIPTYEGWWLDPKGKDFGPNARYYQHDVAEGKKLMAAAGYPNGFEITSSAPGIEYPPSKFGELINGMANDVGIRVNQKILDYLKDYIPNYRDGHGQYEGWSYTSTAGGTSGTNAVGALAIEYWSKGGAAFKGFSLNGKNDQAGDPQVDAIVEKARIEPDVERRKALINDLQRYLAKATYGLASPGGATGFQVAWPAIGNYQVWRGARNHYRLWVDETKPPFKNA